MTTIISEINFVIDNFLFRYLVFYLVIGAFGGVLAYAFRGEKIHIAKTCTILGYLWIAVWLGFTHIHSAANSSEHVITWDIFSFIEMMIGYFAASMLNWETLNDR